VNGKKIMNKKFQVAIVDDEVDITIFLKDYMAAGFDCEIEMFNNPLEALKRFEEKKFDAITLDQRMPEMKGMDLVNHLRNSAGINAKTGILLISANLDEAQTAYPHLVNEVIFLQKPFKFDRFIKLMESILNLKEQQE
jgi:DNA-binding NtrC family response regulator